MAGIPAEYADKLAFVTPAEAAEALKGGEALVLDVRDDDVVGGHVKGSLNAASKVHFTDETAVDAFIDKELKAAGPVKQVIVHCMQSQKRGPSCALKLQDRLKARGLAGSPEISVLTGGFKGFATQYATDAELIEAYDAAVHAQH